MGQVIETKATLVSVVPTVDTNIYAIGDQVGPAVEIPNAVDDSGGTGTIRTVTVIDAAKQKSALDLLLFNSAPTIASSDNAALDISDSEMVAKCIGRLKVVAGDYTDLANNSVGLIRSLGHLVKAANGSRSLWVVVQSRGIPLYTAATDLTLKFGIVQD